MMVYGEFALSEYEPIQFIECTLFWRSYEVDDV